MPKPIVRVTACAACGEVDAEIYSMGPVCSDRVCALHAQQRFFLLDIHQATCAACARTREMFFVAGAHMLDDGFLTCWWSEIGMWFLNWDAYCSVCVCRDEEGFFLTLSLFGQIVHTGMCTSDRNA